MPEIVLPDNELIVDLPDRVINGIAMKRKAHSHSVQIEDMDKRVVMNIMIYYYGTDGEKIDNPAIGITSYLRTLTADNNFFVDAANGIPLCRVSEQFVQDVQDDEELSVENPLLAGKTYVREFQLFSQMQKNPVIINNMKRDKILFAASQGRLD